MKSYSFIFILGTLAPSMASAEIITNPETVADRQVEKIQEMAIPKISEQGKLFSENDGTSLEESSQTLTLDDLAKQPELTEPLLNQALQMRNYISAAHLLPKYRKWKGHDPFFLA